MHSKRIQTHEDDIRAKKANPKEKDCEGLFRKSEQTGLDARKKKAKKKKKRINFVFVLFLVCFSRHSSLDKHNGPTSLHFPFVLEYRLLWRSPRAHSYSRSGDVAVYVFDTNQPSLLTPFSSILTSISVFMALSTVFQTVSSPDNSPLSRAVLPVLFLPYWSFQLSLYESLRISSLVVDWV